MRKHVQHPRFVVPLVVLSFGAIGILLLARSNAATIAASAEAETGTLHGVASVHDVAGASGDKAVLFGVGANGPLGQRISFGLFTTEAGNPAREWRVADILAAETKLGHKVSPVQYFTDFSAPFRLAECQELAKGGRSMLISWQPQVRTQSVIDGASDAYIRQFATDVAKCPAQVHIRLYAEMNGSFAEYSPYHDRDYPGDAGSTHTTSVAQLVSAYRHIIDVFRTVNPGVRWVFSVNETDDPGDASNRMEAYYPGDTYTDVLAFDAYNWGDGGPFSQWREAREAYAEPYRRLMALNASDPVWVTETSSKEPQTNDGYGVNPGKSKGQWVRGLFNMTEYPRINTLVWFDINKQTQPPQAGERDWRVDSSTDSLQALRAVLKMTP